LTERRRAATRAEIVEAAERRFFENGIRNTSLGQVAEGVGIGRPALYNYFPSKDALIAAVIEGVIARFDPIPQFSNTPGTEGIRSVMTEVIASVGRSRADVRFLLMAMLEQLDEPPESQLVRLAIGRLDTTVTVLLEGGRATGEVGADVDCAAEAERLTGDLLGLELRGLMDPAFDFQSAVVRVESEFLARVCTDEAHRT
jgi:AcrR family transcriptional regulator